MTETVTRFSPEKQDPAARPPRCHCCGRDAPTAAFPSSRPGFQVLRCPECGLGRTWPPVAPGEIGAWYPESYYGRENVRFNALFEAMTRIFRRRRARVLHGRVPRGPVLDVGCGRGVMLDHLRALGYEAHGIELSETAARHARLRLGLPVETGDFLSSPHEKDRFHAVIFWHTLEHFPNPVEAVARARELLRPGGLLAVAVPDFDSFQARLFGRRWFHLDVPRHYFHFTPRALEAILSRHAFRVVRTDHFSFEQNPFGWLQSLYNCLGFPENLLYDLLKAEGARKGLAREHPLAVLATALLLPPLLAAALGMTVVEAALRRGGTFEIYAIKE
ncbi:MAG: class I SAM-dependent methyltransferase [Elusimicrobia bacterium]|nr:class I SAM-dependent methyltransferase [Elusimicrobiota bacterium]